MKFVSAACLGSVGLECGSKIPGQQILDLADRMIVRVGAGDGQDQDSKAVDLRAR